MVLWMPLLGYYCAMGEIVPAGTKAQKIRGKAGTRERMNTVDYGRKIRQK